MRREMVAMAGRCEHDGEIDNVDPCCLQCGASANEIISELRALKNYNAASAEECDACDAAGDLCVYHRGFSAGMWIVGTVLTGLVENDFQALDNRTLVEAFESLSADAS